MLLRGSDFNVLGGGSVGFFVLLLKDSRLRDLAVLTLVFVPIWDSRRGGTSFQQLLLPDTGNLIAVEEHAFPLGVICLWP